MRRRSTAVTAVLSALLLLGACGGESAPDPSDGPARWVLEEDLRIGEFEGAGAYTFGQIRAVLPGLDGGIWVLESQVPELRLFDAAGTHVRTVGRRGSGPGEFNGNVCAFAGLDGEVWVEDSSRRWQRFDGAGELLGSSPVTSNLGCGLRRWTKDGRFFAVNVSRTGPPPAPGQSFFVEHHLTEEGDLVPADTFFVPPVPEIATVVWVSADKRYRIIGPLPFTHRPGWHLGWSGDLWTMPGGGAYRIERRSLQGDTLLTIERAYTPVTIPDSIRDRSIREFPPEGMTAETDYDPAQVPRTYPPFERVEEATDGRLWIWRNREGGKLGFDVISSTGEYLATVDVPDDFASMSIHHITGDHMYGVARDDLDVPYVVRLAIRRPTE